LSFYEKLQLLDCDCTQNEPLKNHTTFKIGGPADYFAVPRSLQALNHIVTLANEYSVPYEIIGNGSNILASDSGYRGLVIKMSQKYGDISVSDTLIYADAGVSLARVCKIALDHCLTGIEFAWGIPGSLGGAVYMNAGAYDGEMKDVVDSVVYLDCEDGYRPKTIHNDDCEFGYRSSFFTDKRHIICGVNIRLSKGDRAAIKAKMDDLMDRRITKQPYFVPSAGSTFKRPEGSYASMLVDQCGLKGYAVGDAQVSPKHAGFVVNNKNATCAQVLELIDDIVETVYQKTGFILEREVKLLGE